MKQEENNINDTKWDMLRKADEKGFYDCFHLCYNDLYHLGLFLYKDPALVKECIHLVFIELWKIKDQLRQITNIRVYVFTIFKRILFKQKNGSLNHWSKIDLIDNESEYRGGYALPYEEMMISAQEDALSKQRLASLLCQLTTRQKELIRMRYFEEKSIDEMAAITSLTSRTIYNTLQNALIKLKELVGRGERN